MEGGRISVISVPVSNPDRSKQYYVSVLGFEVVMDHATPGMRWVMLRQPGDDTVITLTTWFETMPPGSLRGTIIAVPDIEAAVADLQAKHALEDDVEIETAPWGRWVSLEDPDGNGWIIQQHAAEPVDLGSSR